MRVLKIPRGGGQPTLSVSYQQQVICHSKASGLKSQRLGSSCNGLRSQSQQEEMVRTALGDTRGLRSEHQENASRANSNPAAILGAMPSSTTI